MHLIVQTLIKYRNMWRTLAADSNPDRVFIWATLAQLRHRQLCWPRNRHHVFTVCCTLNNESSNITMGQQSVILITRRPRVAVFTKLGVKMRSHTRVVNTAAVASL